MLKVSVIGHFGFGQELLNGQTVKTKILTEELERSLGADSVKKIDTHGGAKRLLTIPFSVWKALKSSENVIMLPAHNGLRVIAPIMIFFNRFFKRKLHYSVIGGWLPSFIESRPRLEKSLKKFDNIYVETTTMKRALEARGFSNITVVPNCKELNVLSEDELSYEYSEPYRLCTFSRVMKEKGIEDAIDAIRSVNERLGRTVFSLDIYGPVDPSQTEWFDSLKESFPEYVSYGGSVPFDKSVEVLKDYFALLFPTRFYTEGIPGTVIDAYAAGVPVISAKWESFADLIFDYETGIGYEFSSSDALDSTLTEIANNPGKINSMRKVCIAKANDFSPREALKPIVKFIME